MTEDKKVQEKDQGNAEKPVSLFGAPLKDVVKALLDTKPMQKEETEEETINEGA